MGDDGDKKRPNLARRLDAAVRGLPKSNYWSGISKDVGKYLLMGAFVAPFFGIAGNSTSLFLSVLGMLIAAMLLYVGYWLDPAEHVGTAGRIGDKNET